ncbi:hypothetical protein [Microbacterium sp. SORGH_AS_0888]|uniref:hypothetical protein n=1 Tax=Microbacterium sp. SORGH_AS_0888 TaxID=3041791 RepID=UPI0027898817|nr:hypothetical protein [Microbacterium sp. SORGH_AS_0888]MDQ1128454.1 hypothetical protein [Microbacterium sp. SORGH_AS_0888]
MRRAVVGAATVLAAVLVLSGCMPEPAPSPTPTGFADEDAAFAAAEATYRAYVDALNRVDLSDPATFEDVYRWTTGELNASDRKGLSAYHARGLNLNGASEILTLDRHQASADFNAVSLDVCPRCKSDRAHRPKWAVPGFTGPRRRAEAQNRVGAG